MASCRTPVLERYVNNTVDMEIYLDKFENYSQVQDQRRNESNNFFDMYHT